MDRLGRDDIVLALKALADELSPSAQPLELLVVGGAAPYLVPGRELKAQYAFDDLWGARDAS